MIFYPQGVSVIPDIVFKQIAYHGVVVLIYKKNRALKDRKNKSVDENRPIKRILHRHRNQCKHRFQVILQM
jgi:hypothetical protein